MKLLKNRVAAFGAAGALAAGSVIAGGVISPATAANATYTCNLAGAPTPLDITGTMDLPSSSVARGSSLSGLPTTLGVALPGAVTTLLTGLGITEADGSVSNAKFPIGKSGKSLTSGKLDVGAPVPLVAGQVANLVGKGTSSGTAPSSAGTYNVLMPKSFTFVSATGALPPIDCTTNDPGVLGQLVVRGGGNVEKESSTTAAKFLNTPLTTAKKPLVRVTVKQDDGDPASGVVVVKKGKKVLKKVTLNDAGKKKFRFGKLPAGKNRIVFRYNGDAQTSASKVVKIVTVRRA